MIKRWSHKIKKTKRAQKLEEGIFTWKDPHRIALSLKKTAPSLQSAMGMLNFYINRAGKNLTAIERKTLEKAKVELRNLFNK